MPQSRVQQAHKRAFQSGDPRWMILQQAHEKHWQVRKGEKATTIFFTKPYEVDDEEAEDGRKTIRVLKHYPLFYASQVDGIPAYKASNSGRSVVDASRGNRSHLEKQRRCGRNLT